MFRLDFMVDDKSLPNVMRAIHGACKKVYELNVQPVTVKRLVDAGLNGTNGAKAPRSTLGPYQIFVEEMLPTLANEFFTSDVKALFDQRGAGKNSVSKALREAVKYKSIKKVGYGHYKHRHAA